MLVKALYAEGRLNEFSKHVKSDNQIHELFPLGIPHQTTQRISKQAKMSEYLSYWNLTKSVFKITDAVNDFFLSESTKALFQAPDLLLRSGPNP